MREKHVSYISNLSLHIKNKILKVYTACEINIFALLEECILYHMKAIIIIIVY